MPNESLILPFALPDADRKKPFSQNMEITAVLALAEANRKKPLIADLFPEKIVFVSKLHYPLWIVPWENRSLIVDGLQILSSDISYLVLPEIEPLLNHVERGKSDRRQFFNALSQHEKTFAAFSETQNIQINSIISDKTLLVEIAEYIEEAVTKKIDVTDNIALFPPKLDAEAAEKSTDEFLDLNHCLQCDVKGLEYVSQILNQAAKLHYEKINREIELSNKAFQREIEAIRPSVEKNVDRLLNERDAKTERMNKLARTELNAKQREKERLQGEFQKLELKRVEYKRRLDMRRNRHDKVGIARGEQSLRSCENQLSNAKERLEGLSREIERIQKQNLEDITALQYQFQALIGSEKRKIISVEVSRESIVGAKKNEEERLSSMTARIVGQIEQMAEQRKSQLAGLKELTIAWQPEKAILLALPFYLAAYHGVDKDRCSVFSPFKATSSKGIVKKIKKKLLSFSLSSRIQLLLQPRSKMLDKMLNTCLETMQTDKTLNSKLVELGKTNNLLTQKNLREALTKGVEEMKAEGWIKQEEGAKLIRDYVKG
jgi:hypothetical protein